jgi:uncharacterized protein YndB with AHSA1/START domain
MNLDAKSSALGVLDRNGPVPRLRYERRLAHRPEQVWAALTEPEHLDTWFPTTIDGERATGASLKFEFPSELSVPAMEGKLLSYEPPTLFEFTWGPDTVRFELQAEQPGTLLVLTVDLEAVGKAARDGAGWHVCLEPLELELDGRAARDETSERWREVHPGYVASFGPEAAVDGPPQEWEDAYGGAPGA